MTDKNDIFDSELRQALRRQPRQRLTADDREQIMQRVTEASATPKKRQLWRWIASGVAAALFVTGLGQKMARGVLSWLLTPEDLARVHLPEIPWRAVWGAITGFFDSFMGIFTGTERFFTGAAHGLTEPLAHAARHGAGSGGHGGGVNTMMIAIAACILLLLSADALIRKRVRG